MAHLFLKDCIGYQLNSELNSKLLPSPINHFTISYYYMFMNSCLLLLNLVVVHLQIYYLIFNVLIPSLVYDPSSVLLLKSEIFFLLHSVYLLLIVHSVPSLKLFSFHHSFISFIWLEYMIIDWLVLEYEKV